LFNYCTLKLCPLLLTNIKLYACETYANRRLDCQVAHNSVTFDTIFLSQTPIPFCIPLLFESLSAFEPPSFFEPTSSFEIPFETLFAFEPPSFFFFFETPSSFEPSFVSQPHSQPILSIAHLSARRSSVLQPLINYIQPYSTIFTTLRTVSAVLTSPFQVPSLTINFLHLSNFESRCAEPSSSNRRRSDGGMVGCHIWMLCDQYKKGCSEMHQQLNIDNVTMCALYNLRRASSTPVLLRA
jgi:hypothetical protein